MASLETYHFTQDTRTGSNRHHLAFSRSSPNHAPQGSWGGCDALMFATPLDVWLAWEGSVRPKPNCFQKMAPRIRLYGFRHLKNEAAAEDHVLQVLITTLEALRAGRLLEPEKLASFVLGTCRVMVLDERRGARGEICSVGKLRTHTLSRSSGRPAPPLTIRLR
jgi:hypothetical protein